VLAHGATARGADWSSFITQEVRFAQLLNLCDFSGPFSLNDVGCGYGALISYLAKYHPDKEIDYLGFDVSPEMIRHAMEVRWDLSNATALVADACPRVADYSVASGIFNVKLDHPLDLWERCIARTLRDMHRASRRGFAVNFMAPSGSSSPGMHYWTMPKPWIAFCRNEIQSSVEVLADYGLREFTLLVRPKG
jgi:SAM-dependent methyltransferase